MVKTGNLVIAFVLFAVIGMVFLGPVQNAVANNTGTQSVTNETVTAQVGEYVDVSGYEIDENSETVYGYNDSSGSYEVASEGTDYEINYSSGSVKGLSGSSLIDDGETMKVSYDYQASGSTTTLVLSFIPTMLGVLVFAMVANGVSKKL